MLNLANLMFAPTCRTGCIWLMVIALCLQAATAIGQAPDKPSVTIASKSFTESVILGEILSALARAEGADVKHLRELGGTRTVWEALRSGEVDAYVEYTGTITEEILAGTEVRTLDAIRKSLGDQKILVSQPLGFNNSYALGMKRTMAEELKIEKISDLVAHPDLRFGFSDEFVAREDGWLGLQRKYQLPQDYRGLDHSLAYRGIDTGAIDVIDLYSTDSEIIAYDLVVLRDDLQHFPPYQAVLLFREDLQMRSPQLAKQLLKIEGAIDNPTMTRLNKLSRVDRQPEPIIGMQFAATNLDSRVEIRNTNTTIQRFWQNTMQHGFLVFVSLLGAISIAIPLGILSYRHPTLGRWVLGLTGIIQTIPSIALLVIMIPLFGLGAWPAIVALFLYSLLPIVRGTHTGLSTLPESIHESALALGLSDSARLRLIEIPLALPSIIAGIKTAAVINVGTATIGALIGAGGYGQPIFTGVRLDDNNLILQGAIPAAVLAIAVQAAFGWIEKRVSRPSAS